MSLRRCLSALLLSFCLVFSQQGAQLHALRHELPRAGATNPDGDTGAAGMGCAACLAFAHIAGVATATAVVPVLLCFEDHWVEARPFASRPADAPRTCARGPPTVF